MLKKFSVENFKGFQNKLTLDLEADNYDFNPEVIKNSCISKGIIYGVNSSGKSNLGLALFDIIIHLTERQKLMHSYDFYLNMSNSSSVANFEYEFIFDGHDVIYKYSKNDADSLLNESLSIDNTEVIFFDFTSKTGFTKLEGTDTLNNSINSDSPISRVKFVNNNSILTDNEQNRVFNKFINFVDNMLLFYSLDSRGYEGFMNGTESISEGIINSGKLSDFQSFLNRIGIDYKLKEQEIDGRKNIYCSFNNKSADFFKIASTGTKSLALFYYWYIRMENASLVYIDEFDAFYHFELSKEVQKLLNKLKQVQIFTTTHNTDLMSNDLLRPDCYFLLRDNKITSLSKLTDKEIRKAHNLQKMYKAGAFNAK